MIIEGKHSELGQGIFISDIQEGSNADKVSVHCSHYILINVTSITNKNSIKYLQAGLLVGEMILAVNKDLLVDCNYDSVMIHFLIKFFFYLQYISTEINEFRSKIGCLTIETCRRYCYAYCVQSKQKR